MPRSRYTKVLDQALQPHGFQRHGLDWSRRRGEVEETVNLQPSWIGGRTINLIAKNLETERLYLQILAGVGDRQMSPVSVRLGILIDNCDRWWGDEPTGPQEMADLTVRHGLPWFDRFRTLEDQAATWYGRFSKPTHYYPRPDMIGLALTLHRMGEHEEACAALSKPVPRTAVKVWVERAVRVREWLGCNGSETDPGSPAEG